VPPSSTSSPPSSRRACAPGGVVGAFIDGATNVDVRGAGLHLDTSRLPDGTLKELAGFVVFDHVRQHILALPRGLQGDAARRAPSDPPHPGGDRVREGAAGADEEVPLRVHRGLPGALPDRRHRSRAHRPAARPVQAVLPHAPEQRRPGAQDRARDRAARRRPSGRSCSIPWSSTRGARAGRRTSPTFSREGPRRPSAGRCGSRSIPPCSTSPSPRAAVFDRRMKALGTVPHRPTRGARRVRGEGPRHEGAGRPSSALALAGCGHRPRRRRSEGPRRGLPSARPTP
jgi:hypothetical protein